MKFLVPYEKNKKIESNMEVFIYYNHINNTSKLIDFLKSIFPTRTTIVINADLKNMFFNLDYPILEMYYMKHPEEINFTFEFESLPDGTTPLCKLPHFYSLTANNFARLQFLLNLNVSDVIISEDLLYNLPAVKTLAKDVKIRSYIDGSVSINPYKDFFIYPGDVQHAEPFIDILITPLAPLYDMYSKGTFKGDVSTFTTSPITQYDSDNPLLKMLFDVKCRCGLKCLKGNNCEYCTHLSEKYAAIAQSAN